jgi:Zn-dependent protease with chaperone function
MIFAALAVLAVSVAFAAAAPRLVPALTPARAVRLLVPAAAAVTGAVWFVLAVLAFTWIGQDAEIAALGPWSPRLLAAQAPVTHPAAAAALAVLLTVVGCATAVGVRRARALVEVHRACGRLGAPGSLVVLDTEAPDAFTTPEATGRIVVTRGMLRALSVDETSALLAHEHSHLLHRHTWWILAADLAAAANPMLLGLPGALRQAAERWADEDAAAELADRRLVARAVARAALARHAHGAAPAPSPLAAGTGGDVPARVDALLVPPARPRRLAVAALVLLLTGLAAGTAGVQHQGERLFEHAEITSAAPR